MTNERLLREWVREQLLLEANYNKGFVWEGMWVAGVAAVFLKYAKEGGDPRVTLDDVKGAAQLIAGNGGSYTWEPEDNWATNDKVIAEMDLGDAELRTMGSENGNWDDPWLDHLLQAATQYANRDNVRHFANRVTRKEYKGYRSAEELNAIRLKGWADAGEPWGEDEVARWLESGRPIIPAAPVEFQQGDVIRVKTVGKAKWGGVGSGTEFGATDAVVAINDEEQESFGAEVEVTGLQPSLKKGPEAGDIQAGQGAAGVTGEGDAAAGMIRGKGGGDGISTKLGAGLLGDPAIQRALTKLEAELKLVMEPLDNKDASAAINKKGNTRSNTYANAELQLMLRDPTWREAPITTALARITGNTKDDYKQRAWLTYAIQQNPASPAAAMDFYLQGDIDGAWTANWNKVFNEKKKRMTKGGAAPPDDDVASKMKYDSVGGSTFMDEQIYKKAQEALLPFVQELAKALNDAWAKRSDPNDRGKFDAMFTSFVQQLLRAKDLTKAIDKGPSAGSVKVASASEVTKRIEQSLGRSAEPFSASRVRDSSVSLRIEGIDKPFLTFRMKKDATKGGALMMRIYMMLTHQGLFGESVIRSLIRETLFLEALTKTDRRDIERMARKQAAVILKRDALDKREIEKLATKKAEEAIKKALGVSFIGTRGDINKFVTDNAEKGAEKWLKDKAGKQQVADVTKMIVKKLYKQLAVSSPQVIDRIKV